MLKTILGIAMIPLLIGFFLALFASREPVGDCSVNIKSQVFYVSADKKILCDTKENMLRFVLNGDTLDFHSTADKVELKNRIDIYVSDVENERYKYGAWKSQKKETHCKIQNFNQQKYEICSREDLGGASQQYLSVSKLGQPVNLRATCLINTSLSNPQCRVKSLLSEHLGATYTFNTFYLPQILQIDHKIQATVKNLKVK